MGGGNGCLRLHFEQFEGANSTCFKLFVDQQKSGSPEPGRGASPPIAPPPYGPDCRQNLLSCIVILIKLFRFFILQT